MSKITTLFMHHFVNNVVVNNFNSFKRHGNNIIPMCDFNCNGLDGSWICPQDNDLIIPRIDRKSTMKADTVLLNYILMNPLDSDYYMYCEWDTYCACNLDVFLEPYLGYDMTGAMYFTPRENPNWWWFKGMSLNEFPGLSGCVPASCIFFKRDALIEVAKWVKCNPNIMKTSSECRLTTACRTLGLNIGVYEKKIVSHIRCDKIQITEPNIIYHPVKFVFDDVGYFSDKKRTTK